MTTITTTHTDPTFAPEAGLVPSSVRRVAKLLAGVAGGVTIGWFAGSAAADSSPAVTHAPAAPASAPAAVESPAAVDSPLWPEVRPVSPNAVRAADAARDDRIEACSRAVTTPDAMERCVELGGAG